MELNFHPIINIRTLLIWESVSGKQIHEITNNDDDIKNLKYSALISSGVFMTKAAFDFLYASTEFSNNFDNKFLYSIGYFNSYGKSLFKSHKITELVSLLQETYKIDYNTIVSKMTFQEIERLLKIKGLI